MTQANGGPPWVPDSPLESLSDSLESLHIGEGQGPGGNWPEQVGKHLLDPGDDIRSALLRGHLQQDQVPAVQRMYEEGMRVAELTGAALPPGMKELAAYPFAIRKAYTLQFAQASVDGRARAQFLAGITGGIGAGIASGRSRARNAWNSLLRNRGQREGQLR